MQMGFQLKRSDLVMVNCVCSLDWATQCSDIWSNIFWVLLWGWLYMKGTFEIGRWSKADCCPNVGGPLQISWRPEWNKNGYSSLRIRESLLSDCLQAKTWVSSCLWSWTKHWLFLGAKPHSFQTGTTPLVLLGLQLTGSLYRSRDWTYCNLTVI